MEAVKRVTAASPSARTAARIVATAVAADTGGGWVGKSASTRVWMEGGSAASSRARRLRMPSDASWAV